MDADELVARVEADAATELDRLGSQKLLLALTDADLSTAAVLGAAAASERAAAETFDRWAGDEPDGETRDLFAAVADEERDHYRRVRAELDADPADATDPLHAHLRGVEGTVDRVAAGLVGRGLVADRTHLQLVNFFVNEADERRADLFRALREETADQRARGCARLDALADDAAWDRARAAAVEAVSVAYGAYEDALAGMGVDPRPVC